MPPQEISVDPVTLKELELLDAGLGDIDNEIIAKQYLMSLPIMAQRQKTIAKIPSFWPVVLENAAPELEWAITPADSDIISKALVAIELTRPEIPPSAKVSDVGLDKFGEPRSVTIKFHFKENEWFSDSVLEKTFHYRYGKDKFAGLVSEPVRINWKAGKDVTEGLTDAAFALWAAQRKQPAQKLDGVVDGDEKTARDAAAQAMPEYKKLAALLKSEVEGAISFFNFFSYRGRWISAAESREARAELRAKRQAALQGNFEDDSDDEEDEDEEEDDVEAIVETFPPGDDVAAAFADDIWPSAIDYFLAETIDSDDDLDGVEIDEDTDEDEDDDVEMS